MFVCYVCVRSTITPRHRVCVCCVCVLCVCTQHYYSAPSPSVVLVHDLLFVVGLLVTIALSTNFAVCLRSTITPRRLPSSVCALRSRRTRRATTRRKRLGKNLQRTTEQTPHHITQTARMRKSNLRKFAAPATIPLVCTEHRLQCDVWSQLVLISCLFVCRLA